MAHGDFSLSSSLLHRIHHGLASSHPSVGPLQGPLLNNNQPKSFRFTLNQGQGQFFQILRTSFQF